MTYFWQTVLFARYNENVMCCAVPCAQHVFKKETMLASSVVVDTRQQFWRIQFTSAAVLIQKGKTL